MASRYKYYILRESENKSFIISACQFYNFKYTCEINRLNVRLLWQRVLNNNNNNKNSFLPENVTQISHCIIFKFHAEITFVLQ